MNPYQSPECVNEQSSINPWWFVLGLGVAAFIGAMVSAAYQRWLGVNGPLFREAVVMFMGLGTCYAAGIGDGYRSQMKHR
jgi:hypothetical protein